MSTCIVSLTVSTIILCLSASQQAVAFWKEDPDVHKNVVELIQSKGYVVENHTVQTADGYLLGTFRIPHGRAQRNGDKTTKKPVALLMTSLGADCSQFVLNFPNQSLGFILADSGYDVWFNCPRGCTYSQKHVNISANTDRFWDFSWEEIGTLDLPATVDFVLSQTKQDKLFLVSQSMGSTASLVFLSLRPEYNNRIKALLAMSPVANLSHMTNIMRNFVPIRDTLYKIFKHVNHGNLFTIPTVSQILSHFCSLFVIRVTACNFLLFFGDGVESPHQYNQTRFPVYASHFPGGGSAKELYHYGQVAAAKQFVRFDYGTAENLKLYGQKTPPEYPVEKISVPVAIFWSTKDQQADPVDVASLRERLNNVIEFYKVPFSPFTHLDYVIGINAYEAVYKRLMEIMEQYRDA